MSANARTKKTHGDRALKKLRGIKKGIGMKLDKAIHTVTITARKPVIVDGFLVSCDKNFVVFRHRKTSASKKMRTSTIPAKVVISVTGTVGEASQLLMWKDASVLTLRGYAKVYSKRGYVVITDIVSGEKITVYMNDSVTVDIHADDDEKAQKLPKRGKRKVSDDEDEDGDDEDFENESELDTGDVDEDEDSDDDEFVE